ncbi:MAG: glycosyltransferase family 2 protein [Acidobacteriaceae bacterium]|nr:glycosyltransferase family 2 protein [Acidobacteriaceae bacterium]
MPAPRVSVIVPAYNVTAYVREALESLRAQTFRDFETVLVNDGCPDTGNLEKAVAPYAGEIVYLKTTNGGVARARNAGIQLARGDFVAFLDPDDFWEREYLESQMAMFDANRALDLVYPDAIVFGETPWAGSTRMTRFPFSGTVSYEAIATLRCRIFCGATVRRDAILRLGAFDATLSAAEDFDLWLRLARSGAKMAYNCAPLVHYRVRAGSLSRNKVVMKRAIVRVYDKHLQDEQSTEAERKMLRAMRERHAGELELLIAKGAAFEGDRQEAIEHLRRANRILRSPKLGLATLALQVRAQWVKKFLHWRYGPKYLDLS